MTGEVSREGEVMIHRTRLTTTGCFSNAMLNDI